MARKTARKQTSPGGCARMNQCCGTVEFRSGKKVYLRLDTGEGAFAYGPGDLREGAEVLCRVKKLAQGARQIQVTVKAVLRSGCEAA